MAPVIAAALISAAATMAKAKQDQKANAAQGGGDYSVDVKTPQSGNTNSQPQMQIEEYKPAGKSQGNNKGAMIDAASGVGKAIIEDKLNNQNNNSISTLGWQSSDERLKNIFGDNEDAIKAFAKINAIEFTYNDKAKEIPNGESNGVDDDKHFGVKAQELAENPLTESAVKKDPLSEYLEVDTKELTMANTAIISEICKRILILEKVLGIKVV
jgi:hypothetical protein